MHHRDLLVVEQVRREVAVVLDGAAVRRPLSDRPGAVHVEVERAPGRVAGQPAGLVEHRGGEVAPLLEHRQVVPNERLIAVERLDPGPLADARRAARGLGLDLRHRRDQRVRPRPVADAPSRHAVGLREPVHGQGALVQIGRNLRHRRERPAAVDDVLVDVVGEHPHAGMPSQHLGKPLQIARRVDGPGRVAGVVQDQPLRSRGNRALELLRRQPESARGVGGDRHRGPAREQGHVRITHPERGGGRRPRPPRRASRRGRCR